jgi:hypothetical protein
MSGLGDVYVTGFLRARIAAFDLGSAVTIGAPTGDRDKGFCAGKVTVDATGTMARRIAFARPWVAVVRSCTSKRGQGRRSSRPRSFGVVVGSAARGPVYQFGCFLKHPVPIDDCPRDNAGRSWTSALPRQEPLTNTSGTASVPSALRRSTGPDLRILKTLEITRKTGGASIARSVVNGEFK